MDSKHTPGEWIASYNPVVSGPTTAAVTGPCVGGPNWPYRTVTCGAETIAIVPAQDRGAHIPDVDVAVANARLIAAAPKLLAACKTLLAAVNCNYCNALVASEYGDMLRAAIAEAEGE